MTIRSIAPAILLAIYPFLSPAHAEDSTSPTTPPPAASPPLPILRRPASTPAPEKRRKPFNVAFNELSGFNYDLESRAFYFDYNGESYWFHIGRIDPDARPETGLLLLGQIRASKVLRIEALTDLVNGFVVVKNISLYY